jgi:hypothetical protein
MQFPHITPIEPGKGNWVKRDSRPSSCDSMKLTMNMPDELHLKFKVHCAKTKQEMTTVVNQLVREYLEKAPAKKKAKK